MEQELYQETRFDNYRELICHSAAEFGRRPAFQLRAGDGYRQISYRELRERYYALCGQFLSMGLQGRRIAVIGENSFPWVLAYLSAATVGCAVPLDRELHTEDIREFIAAADCAAVCCGDGLQERVLPALPAGVRCVSFSDVLGLSEAAGDWAAVDRIPLPRDETQILIFTSGTTGASKGVCLSQYNVCSDIFSTVQAVKINAEDVTLSILPLHHTYECTLNCLLILSRGGKIAYCDGLGRIPRNLREYRPSVLVVVPVLLKVLSKRIRSTVAKQLPLKYRACFEERSLAQAMEELPFVLQTLVCAQVRKALGGRLRLFIVGAAELDVSRVEDFAAVGIRTLQGYGLTECSPLLAGNSDFFLNPVSTGVAMPGIELKIDAPNREGVGEILARGDNVMLGYYNDPAATRRVFRDGWFCTGDLGRLGADGALYIMGRLKNVIVTENGKNIYPEELENRLSQYPAVRETIVVGERDGADVCQTRVKAKILPDLDFLERKLGRIPSREDIYAAVQQAVREVNSRIPSYKHIKLVEILESALEKTSTQKIKRCGGNLA